MPKTCLTKLEMKISALHNVQLDRIGQQQQNNNTQPSNVVVHRPKQRNKNFMKVSKMKEEERNVVKQTTRDIREMFQKLDRAESQVSHKTTKINAFHVKNTGIVCASPAVSSNSATSAYSARVETGQPGQVAETETGRGGAEGPADRGGQGAVGDAKMNTDDKPDVVVVRKPKYDDNKHDDMMMKGGCHVSVSVSGRRSYLDPGRGGKLDKGAYDRVSLGGVDGGDHDPGHKPRGWVKKSRNLRKSEVAPTIKRSASSLQSKILLFEGLNQGKIATEYNSEGDLGNHVGKGDRI